MIEVRRAYERFHTELEWLDSWHSFSFGPHYNEKHVQFGPLRVLNDDTVSPGGGFGTHRHREMEIVSVVLEGALAHKDSTGAEGVLRAGEVQRMSAGTGVEHAEYNASDTEPVKFLQIWVTPAVAGLAPSYESADFGRADKMNKFVPVVSGRGAKGALRIHQDAEFLMRSCEAREAIEFRVGLGRRAYVFVIEGAVDAGGAELARRDAAKVEAVEGMTLEARAPSELLVITLP